MKHDLEHLKILSIFHYVVAGLIALFACIPGVHFVMGLLMATGGFEDAPGEARVFGVLFMVLAGLFILAGWALAVAVFLTGRFLAGRRHHTFCLVVAGVECIFMPVGTVLGVFTILVLVRDSVRELFTAAGQVVTPAPGGGSESG